MTGAQLEVNDLRVRYGSIEAVHGISLMAARGEVVTLIGGNGAGKTTTLRAISMVHAPAAGSIVFEGTELTKLRSDEVVDLGIVQVPESRHVFPTMTVLENLEMGAFRRRRGRRGAIEGDLREVYDLFPILEQRTGQLGGTLSGGEQQMLAMGRALMAKPRLLMLDEPSMGLAPQVVQTVFEVIEKINSEGTTVLLVEQNARMALEAASRGYVIENGDIVLEDESEKLLGNAGVRKAYLGER